jgi:hypothetical protein
VGITVGQTDAIVANTAKISYTDAAAVALNTAKVGITAGQTADITANNAKISYTDAAVVSTNTSDIAAIEAAQTTQDSAIALNTAKVGITVGQTDAIVANTAKISYTDAAAVALNTAKVGITVGQTDAIVANTAKISYTDAAAVALNTAKVGITVGQTDAIVANTAKVSNIDILPLDNTFTGTNSFTGVKNVAISGNGSGTAVPTAAIINDVTQSITGAGSVYGQELPALVKDTGTYNLTNSAIFGIGGLFIAEPVVNLTGTGPFLAAGPYQSLAARPTINKAHAAAQACISYPIWVQTTINNTGGGGAMTATESALYVGLTFGTNVTVTDVSAVQSAEPTAGAGTTIASNLGIRCAEKTIGTSLNAGYHYGDVLATDGQSLCFDSSSSGHAARFGGGTIHPVTIVTTVAPTLDTTHSKVSLTGSASCVLPAVSAVPTGMTYQVFNNAGANRTVTSASTITGLTAVIATATSRTFVNDGTIWLSGY